MTTSSIPFSRTDHSITYFDSDFRSRTVADDHPNFGEIRDLLISGEATHERLWRLMDVKQAVTDFGRGRIEIRGATVYMDGQPLHNALTARMLYIMRAGGDVTPLSNFQLRLSENPSAQAVEELFLWVEASALPIMADGRFVAYKKVRDDYTSYHSGPGGEPVYNRVGDTPTMERNKVDDRRNNTCSYGLHFCSYDYLPYYYGGSGRVMVLAVDPANVVSIPSDYDNAKGRAWTYEVIGEVSEANADTWFTGTPVVNSDLSAYTPDEVDDLDDVIDTNGVSFYDPRSEVTWTLREIFEEIDYEGGKRAAARSMGVPESTLRGWVRPFEEKLQAYLDGDLI